MATKKKASAKKLQNKKLSTVKPLSISGGGQHGAGGIARG